MYLHVVEQTPTVPIQREPEEISKADNYLSSLDIIDGLNLRSLLHLLLFNLLSETRVLAIDDSVRGFLAGNRDYDSIAIKLFGTGDSLPILSQLVYNMLRDISNWKVEGRSCSEVIARFAHNMQSVLPFSMPLCVFEAHPEEGKTIDILISNRSFDTYIKKMQEHGRPYVILH